MESYNNRDLINLTELGKYLKSVIEFCVLHMGLNCVKEIKWNIQWFDLKLGSDSNEESNEYFLEVVIVLKASTLSQQDKSSIIQMLKKFFIIDYEQPKIRIIKDKTVLITKIDDTQKERFTLKSGGKGIPDIFKNYEVTISIESMVRDMLQSAKLILSSEDIQNEDRKIIKELIKERSNIQARLNAIQKPVVICEGKTDIKIIKTAWNKLNPNIEIPFQILPSGIWIEIDESEGNADQVRRLLELYSPINTDEKKVVGLFDNDREGNEQFNGLSKKLFDLTSDIIKKHKTKLVYGMLLPVPPFRKVYFGTSLQHRFFVIEHYFSDRILERNNMKGEAITPDSAIFRISGDKDKFSDSIADLDKTEFENMTILFDELKKIICL